MDYYLYFCRRNQARMEAGNHRERMAIPFGCNVLRPSADLSDVRNRACPLYLGGIAPLRVLFHYFS